MPATMCDLATKLPLLVGTLLDREAKLQKGRFREETMTDLLTGALAAFAGPNLVIRYPDEAKTGADLDLRFWNVAADEELFVRIQAKRLNAEKDGSRMRKVEHRSYQELLHKPNKTAPHQYETLKEAPSPWVPLYMFYNHQAVVSDTYFAGSAPAVSGVNLAFAYDIATELDRKLDAAAKNKQLHHLRLSYLRKHFFGLEAILCPAGDWGGEDVPPPRVVSASLLEMYRRGGDTQADLTESVLRILSEDGRLRVDRGAAWRLPDGAAIRSDQTIDRPEITFISGRTDDDRTPKITLGVM